MRRAGSPWWPAPVALVAAAAAAAAAALLAGCGGGSERAPESVATLPPDTLVHEERKVERAEGDCGREGADSVVLPCVSMTVTYPEITGGPSAALVDSVRAFVLEMAAGAPGVTERSEGHQSPDSAAAAFVRDYEEYTAQVPSDFPRPWYLEREVRLMCNTPSMVSVRADEASYTGGAHGMTVARLASFDPETGRRLGLDDWVTDREAATEAGERAFRRERDIPERQSLRRAGFTFFEGSRFALNDNVMRCGDTLTFHYDPYEVGPYVLGPTDLELPLSAIPDSARRR